MGFRTSDRRVVGDFFFVGGSRKLKDMNAEIIVPFGDYRPAGRKSSRERPLLHYSSIV